MGTEARPTEERDMTVARLLASRLEQGLPPLVNDAAVIAKVAALLPPATQEAA
jgi:hypothetical protein